MKITHLLAIALLALTACNGGATPLSGTIPHASARARSVANIRIAIPERTTTGSAAKRRPAFVSGGTNGAVINLYASSDTTHANLLATATIDLSSASTVCTVQTNGSRLCALAIPAPPSAVGDPTDFIFTTYDTAPVGGVIPVTANALGTGTAVATIAVGSANTINVTLSGIVASASVFPLNPSPVGSRATSTVLVVAQDASGATIIGPDDYATPLTLTSSSAFLTLTDTPQGGTATSVASSVTVNAPSDLIAYQYIGDTNNGASSAAITLGLASGSTSLASGALAPTPTGTITQYTVAGASDAFFTGITNGPDGNLWFTEACAGTAGGIGKITTAGTVTQYSIAGTSQTFPQGIAAGPDGNLWFAQANSGQIGRITTAGTITEYNVSGGGPLDITTGSDGKLWFTDPGNDNIGSITTTGTIAEFGSGALHTPEGITAGPDGKLWFTESSNGQVGNVTTAGAFSQFTGNGSGTAPTAIAAGPDGNLWFTQETGGQIGKMTTAGVLLASYSTSSSSNPKGIAAGPDGNMWATLRGADNIARVSTSGVVTQYGGGALGQPIGITVGPDGNMWFAECASGQIGKIVP